MVCKGICVRHKALKPVGNGRYSTGQKRCQICETFLKWDGLWCPCCGYRLRTRPRNLKYKAKLQARKKRDEYRLTLEQQARATRVYKFIKNSFHTKGIIKFTTRRKNC